MKLWGGRFSKDTDETVEAFTASISFDKRLYREDIAGSIAHCRMLGRQGIIGKDEADLIESGLNRILIDIECDQFIFRDDLEDIHMNIEAQLKEIIGEAAGKLHTARSRNDQIALDLRMHTRTAILDTVSTLIDLQEALRDTAEVHNSTVIPGYTHLQRAQPVLLSHHFLAYFEMFQRDIERFLDCYVRVNVLPLGSGALAGVPYPIDRTFVAEQLGFAKVSQNSLDAVSDRDFIIEFISSASTAMMHLSRLAEEIILWSTAEFGFIELDDAYTTGSSMMPQKKNPDVAELVRGKTGRVYGNLTRILTLMKALPLSYNRDLQEDKIGLFDTIDTLLDSAEVFAGMLRTMKVNKGSMRSAAEGNYMLATDIADYLVRKGIPFRGAHAVVGKLVLHAIEQGKRFSELSLEEYKTFSTLFEEDILAITVESSVTARDNAGGTAPSRVESALLEASNRLADNKTQVEKLSKPLA